MRALRQAFSIREAFAGIGQSLPLLGARNLAHPERLDEPRFVRLASLEGGHPEALSFLSDRRYLKQAQESLAGAILLPPAFEGRIDHPTAMTLAVEQPYLIFARLSQWVATRLEAERVAAPRESRPFTSLTAVLGTYVDPSATLGPNVRLAPGVVIGAGTQIGEGSVIEAHCVIGRDCRIGPNSRLFPHVVMYDDCELGSHVIVHSGTVIGSDGFGFAKGESAWIKIAQLGAVRIGDDVEIGSNCSIDRGTIEDTVIEDGCKLDNLIQIAHNVQVGAQSVLAACVGVAGSARIGKRCMIGGSVGVLGHLRIADDVTVTPMSLVMSTITQAGVYSGSTPLQAHRDWEKTAAIQRGLPDLRSRIRALEALNKNKSEKL